MAVTEELSFLNQKRIYRLHELKLKECKKREAEEIYGQPRKAAKIQQDSSSCCNAKTALTKPKASLAGVVHNTRQKNSIPTANHETLNNDTLKTTTNRLNSGPDNEAPELAQRYYFSLPNEPPTPPEQAFRLSAGLPDNSQIFWRAVQNEWEESKSRDKRYLQDRISNYGEDAARAYPRKYTQVEVRKGYMERMEGEDRAEAFVPLKTRPSPPTPPRQKCETPVLAKEYFFSVPNEPPTPPDEAELLSVSLPEEHEDFWPAVEEWWNEKREMDEDQLPWRIRSYGPDIAREFSRGHTPQVVREGSRQRLGVPEDDGLRLNWLPTPLRESVEQEFGRC